MAKTVDLYDNLAASLLLYILPPLSPEEETTLTHICADLYQIIVEDQTTITPYTMNSILYSSAILKRDDLFQVGLSQFNSLNPTSSQVAAIISQYAKRNNDKAIVVTLNILHDLNLKFPNDRAAQVTTIQSIFALSLSKETTDRRILLFLKLLPGPPPQNIYQQIILSFIRNRFRLSARYFLYYIYEKFSVPPTQETLQITLLYFFYRRMTSHIPKLVDFAENLNIPLDKQVLYWVRWKTQNIMHRILYLNWTDLRSLYRPLKYEGKYFDPEYKYP
eukprot:TRINITY_DN24044_c0_g1_i1.p1 TRINITY_DN24044_c0_g1~~TRINITY_DN24044_c0_g1_i1.p1  ORF type:complete len:298 (-),score=29.44 TRINITY_DN24044_c0_g1_i1:2-829(-)